MRNSPACVDESEACVQRLEQGLAAQDVMLASRAAHSLKGSSSNLGAHKLATVCAAMEQGATGQSDVVCALCVGIVNRSLKRAEVSTPCTAAEFEMLVVRPNDPLRSKVLVMPWPKWS